MNKPVGRVAREFGLGGELSLNLYDTFPQEPDFEEPLFVTIDALAVPLFIESFARRGVSGATVRFADFDTKARAAELIGRELYAADAEKEADTDDEFYMEDFVGFEARFSGNKAKGKIVDYTDDEFNPLFVVDVEGHEVLVPAVDDFVSEYSVERQTIRFDLPEGLLELN